MKNVERPRSSYESYCFNCKVTFPIETRRCLHCGERVSNPQKRVRGSIDQMAKQIAEASRKREQTSPSREASDSSMIEELAAAGIPGAAPGAAFPKDDVDELIPKRRSPSLTMIWILLAFVGATVRACSGG